MVACEHEPDRAFDPGSVGVVPPCDPRGEVVEPAQRARGTEDRRRPLVDGCRGRGIGTGQVDEPVAQRGGSVHGRNSAGSRSGTAKPATISNAVSA